MLNCLRVLLRRCPSGFVALFVLVGANAQPVAMQTAPPPESKSSANIGAAWDNLLQGSIPQSAPDPALTVAQVSYEVGRANDFPDHFFMNARIDYLRTQTFFTGLPTLTGVIDAPPSEGFNPNGIPYPPAFQSDTNTMYSFLNFGTQGWLSDRVNSNFTFAYSGNVTHVTNASPQLSILDTFGSSSLFQLVSAYVDINGQPTDGIFAGTSLRFGRQAVYGAELAEFDGASFTHGSAAVFLDALWGAAFYLLLGSGTAGHRGRKFSVSVHPEHQPGIRHALLHQRNKPLPLSPGHWEHVDVRRRLPHGGELSDRSLGGRNLESE